MQVRGGYTYPEYIKYYYYLLDQLSSYILALLFSSLHPVS